MVKIGVFGATLAAALACGIASASAADCPGNPDALGTARTLVVDAREHPRIGGMQYGETLPLADREVVLTFDDGPLPPKSDQVLQALAAECVKATFFVVGRMAKAYPEGVRRMAEAGHSIGTHSQNHPLSFHRMGVEQARQEVDDGIAATRAALGDDKALAPFFRIPGLLRAEAVESYLAAAGLQAWSADFPADDWHPISSERVLQIALQRLEAKGKGILLLHDIQPRTVGALPKLLRELKARGYRVVHVVAATPDRPKTETAARDWRIHPAAEAVAVTRWPKAPRLVYAAASMLPAPALTDAALHDGKALWFGAPRPGRVATAWPAAAPLPAVQTAALPVPAAGVFAIAERTEAALGPVLRPLLQRAAQQGPDAIAQLIARDGGQPTAAH